MTEANITIFFFIALSFRVDLIFSSSSLSFGALSSCFDFIFSSSSLSFGEGVLEP